MHTVRTLRRHWKPAVISVASLAIAMALGVICLSVSNTTLLLLPSAPEPDRLVTIHARSAGNPVDQMSYPDYRDYRANSHVFTDIAAAPNSISLLADFQFEGRNIKLLARPVSDNYFAVMAIQPHLGRFFSPADSAANTHLAVMTYSCWKRLGSDPKIVGKVLAGNTIIGVTPRNFTGSFYGLNGDLSVTLSQADSPASWEQRSARRLFLTARLKPGVSRRQAQAEMDGLSHRLAAAYPKDDKDRSAVVARASLLPPDALATAELMTAILMALALLVLLIACANVANLLLAIAVARRQEAAIKLALGASRGRLVRESLQESALLSTAAGVLGFGIAAAALALYSDLSFSFPMFGAFSVGLNLRLDFTVAALTLVLILIATLATGLAPAVYASSPHLALMMRGDFAVGGAHRNVRRSALVIVEVAACTLVMIGMGLCQRSLYNLRHIDLGFSARNLVAATLYLDAEGYSEKTGRPFYQTLRERVSTIPGVESVSLAGNLPLLGATEIPAQLPAAVNTTQIAHTVVDPFYFSTLGIKLLGGRNFNSNDREGSPAVVLVNQKMAGMFWPGQDPVGKVVMAGDPARRLTVVGVVTDGKYDDLEEPPRPFLYYALGQNYHGAVNVIARTKADPELWVEPLARTLRGLGLKVMIHPATLQEWMNLTLLGQRIAAGCVAALSALGLLLAVIGLFGAISYSVSERTRELGIRVALGAAPWRLLKMILAQTAFLTGIGVVLGTLLGVGATVLFQSQFYGVSPVEWTVLLPVCAAMLIISLLVSYLSAKPWITIQPMEAIRHA